MWTHIYSSSDHYPALEVEISTEFELIIPFKGPAELF